MQVVLWEQHFGPRIQLAEKEKALRILREPLRQLYALCVYVYMGAYTWENIWIIKMFVHLKSKFQKLNSLELIFKSSINICF